MFTIFSSGLQLDEPLRRDDFGLGNDILGGDGFGDEFGEGVLPPLEDLPTISGLDVTLDPLRDVTENGEVNVEQKMETDEQKLETDDQQMEVDIQKVPDEEQNIDHEMPSIGKYKNNFLCVTKVW